MQKNDKQGNCTTLISRIPLQHLDPSCVDLLREKSARKIVCPEENDEKDKVGELKWYYGAMHSAIFNFCWSKSSCCCFPNQ